MGGCFDLAGWVSLKGFIRLFAISLYYLITSTEQLA